MLHKKAKWNGNRMFGKSWSTGQRAGGGIVKKIKQRNAEEH